MDPRIIAIVVASAILLTVPGAAADHPDHDCWGMDGAVSCFVKDGPDGAAAFARRVCDEVTGQACTSP